MPFCAASCPYCDYPHAVAPDAHADFVDALCTEMRLRDRFHGAPAQTLYLGGGTPSRLSAAHLEKLFETIRACFDLSPLEEVTLEANPDDLSPLYLESLRALGVNRLSLGVQSFFEEDLRFLGRQHTAAEAVRAVPLAREAGFENVSVDLLFGLPTQTEARWLATLERAIRQRPAHVTLYRLTAEAGTPLGRRVASGAVTLPPEDAVAAQYERALDALESAGFELCEQTHLARPGFEAQHTRRYWRHAPVLGFGPGAHSFFWTDDGATRHANAASQRASVASQRASVASYVAALSKEMLPPARSERLSRNALAEEYVALRLRTTAGLDPDVLSARYGYDLPAEKAEALDRLRAEGYVEDEDGRLRATRAGRLRLDAVVAAVLV